ncbi:MAG: nitronate monooxygenase, partial [Stellaceae bacterium]
MRREKPAAFRADRSGFPGHVPSRRPGWRQRGQLAAASAPQGRGIAAKCRPGDAPETRNEPGRGTEEDTCMWPTNALTERLKLKWPILQAPMGSASTPALAAAVTNAGGLGGLGMWG